MRTPAPLLAAGALAVLSLLGACSKSEEPTAPVEQGAGKYSISDADKRVIAAKFPTAVESKSGLMSIITKPGVDTKTPRYGTRVTVNYTLRLLDGTLIESNPLTEPLRFPVGVGRVIRGWDEALMEMTRGEKRTLIIPHYLAYGMTGSPPKIPPYATLVFEVELIDIN